MAALRSTNETVGWSGTRWRHRQGHDTQGGIAKHGRDEARLGDQLQVAIGLPGERRRIMA
ncbi:hypothetical protein C2W62_23785 [Candidatus Entotheonella serta]|nr:hypothetical protein C2W62_23785 [Candidatus Entotheonella serta]